MLQAFKTGVPNHYRCWDDDHLQINGLGKYLQAFNGHFGSQKCLAKFLQSFNKLCGCQSSFVEHLHAFILLCNGQNVLTVGIAVGKSHDYPLQVLNYICSCQNRFAEHLRVCNYLCGSHNRPSTGFAATGLPNFCRVSTGFTGVKLGLHLPWLLTGFAAIKTLFPNIYKPSTGSAVLKTCMTILHRCSTSFTIIKMCLTIRHRQQAYSSWTNQFRRRPVDILQNSWQPQSWKLVEDCHDCFDYTNACWEPPLQCLNRFCGCQNGL